MFKDVELYEEPREILNYLEDSLVEMSQGDHGFLCGLIKMQKPQKVLEVGVYAGGTTSVIMKCLEKVNPSARMYSVDIAEECYKKDGKVTGFQLHELKQYLDNYEKHRFLLGKILPDVIDDIGDDIDFVILDTVHGLPGEMLDFLCLLPYLKQNAIVVLHDIANNWGLPRNAFATRVLLTSVSGEKYYNYREGVYNIAAFRVTQETRNTVANVFSALSISWVYMPDEQMLSEYRKAYARYYDDECMELFDTIVTAQKHMRYVNEDVQKSIKRLRDVCDSNKKIFVCDSGHIGEALRNCIKNLCGKDIDGYIVADSAIAGKSADIKENNIPMYGLNDVPINENCAVLLPAQNLPIKHDLIRNKIEFISFSRDFTQFLLGADIKKATDIGSRFLFPFEKIAKTSTIILYGAGAVGKSYFGQIEKSGYCRIVAWVDREPHISLVQKPAVIYDGIEFDYVVIAVEKEELMMEIKDFLLNNGIDDKKIVWREP